jgi:hypothetical protein
LGFISQKTAFFIVTAAKISNLTQCSGSPYNSWILHYMCRDDTEPCGGIHLVSGLNLPAVKTIFTDRRPVLNLASFSVTLRTRLRKGCRFAHLYRRGELINIITAIPPPLLLSPDADMFLCANFQQVLTTTKGQPFAVDGTRGCDVQH